MKYSAFVALASSLFAIGSASAATFSFAADAFSAGPQIIGSPGNAISSSLSQGSGNTGTLIIDADGNGPGAPVNYSVQLVVSATMNAHQTTPVAPGIFLHSYAATGNITFVQTGVSLPQSLRMEFANGVFTSISNSATAWGGSATLQANDQAGSVSFVPGTDGGFVNGDLLAASRSFSFGLSNVVLASGGQVTLNSVGGQTGFVTGPWQADASFTAFAVPTPGSVALMALGGIAMAFGRKRR